MKKLALLAVAGLSGCVVQVPPERGYVQAPSGGVYQPASSSQGYYSDNNAQQDQVVSAYVEPPLMQPEPVLVQWAPPPMLVEAPPPQPYEAAVWTGGYWVWEGNWIWAHGRWSAPPQYGYTWVQPYYENRGGAVVFVNGFWAAPGIHFVQPSYQLHLTFAAVNRGVIAGPRPIGPEGVFVPPPPGSVRGLIVPAPIGTSPAVVTGAPPIVRGGMRVHIENNSHNTTVINNVSNHVTLIAPPGTTANGQAVNKSVPAQAQLAAQMTPVVRAMAPEPVSNRPIPAYTPGRAPIALPAPQPVHFNNQAGPGQGQQQIQPHQPQYGQGQQQAQPQSQSQPQPQPQPGAHVSAIPVQQRQTMPVSQDRFLSQPQEYSGPAPRRAPENAQPQQQSPQQQPQYNQPINQLKHIESTPVMPVQRPVNVPNVQETRPVQNNQANDMRIREEMERKSVPVQRIEQRSEQRGQGKEKDEKLKGREQER